MQILKISVYGVNGERRDVEFIPSKVNIITGSSKKGKSSLIDIVEYCLGSSECNVAEGYIRKTVAWYAILLQFPDTEVFIARAAPMSGRKSNSACHMLIANKVIVPEHGKLENSTNISSVVDFLTSKIGIPEQVTEVPEGQTRANIRIGFKHSRYYLFQGQDEVAAKRILFHRQAEPHIPQAIKDTLPYFMGAAEDDRLSELDKLRNLKRDRARLQKRIRENESIRGDGMHRGFDLLAEASAVGLYDGDLVLSDEELLRVLHQLNNWSPSKAQEKDLESDPFSKLNKQYRGFAEQKRVVRSKLRAVNEYAGSLDGFEDELNEQRLRLQSIGIFKNIIPSAKCPICETEHSDVRGAEEIIFSSIANLNLKLEGVSRNKPRVTSYLETLRDEDRQLAAGIKKTRGALDRLRQEEIELSEKGVLDDRKARMAGRISLYLESVDWNDDTSHLEEQLKAIEPKIEELEASLDPEALKERLESQLSLVAEDMTRWARDLGLEHSEYPIRLDAKNLTVVAETPHGRIPLYRMGSGENWVGYHLITYIALAKWFIKQNRPVGRFIFFDQPTQVYFPSEQDRTGSLEEISRDEDREAVRRMFKWLFQIVSELHPDLQVIITDHADIDEEWFQSAIADTKWRGDAALIPSHWYE